MLVGGRGCCLGGKKRKEKMKGEKNSLFHGNICRKAIDSCVSACFFKCSVFNRPKENLYELICM